MAKNVVPMFKNALRVTATVDGFRRGGIAHPMREVVHAPETFTAEQAQQILDEAAAEQPKLIVRELTDAEYKAAIAADKKGDKSEAAKA